MTLVLPAMIAAIVSILFGSVAAAVVSHALGAARGDAQYKIDSFQPEQQDGARSERYAAEFVAAIEAVRKCRDEINDKIFDAAKDVRRGRVLQWFRSIMEA